MSSISQNITNAVHQVYKKGKSEQEFLQELLGLLCPGSMAPEPKAKKPKLASPLPECKHCTVADDHLEEECPCMALLMEMEAKEGKVQVADPADELVDAMESMVIEKPKRRRSAEEVAEAKAAKLATKEAEKKAKEEEKAVAKAAKEAEKKAKEAEKAEKPKKARSKSPPKEKTAHQLEVEKADVIHAEKAPAIAKAWTPEGQMEAADSAELTEVVWKAETYQVDKIGGIYLDGEHVGQVGLGEFFELHV